MTDEKDIEKWRDPEHEERNPNALTYGISPSAPASIRPVDIEQWKGKVAPTFKHYFTERYNELVRQYEELVNDYHINKMLYESEDRKSTRLNSSHSQQSRMPSSA